MHSIFSSLGAKSFGPCITFFVGYLAFILLVEPGSLAAALKAAGIKASVTKKLKSMGPLGVLCAACITVGTIYATGYSIGKDRNLVHDVWSRSGAKPFLANYFPKIGSDPLLTRFPEID